MARNTELTALVLDCAPSMAPCLPYLREAVSAFLHSKLEFKPFHEVALVLLGTATTDNRLHSECAQANADDQYVNITTLGFGEKSAALHRPTKETFRTFEKALRDLSPPPPPNNFYPDFVNALSVALDEIVTSVSGDARREKLPKRIILISNFLSPIEVSIDTDNFLDSLCSTMIRHGVTLEIYSVDVPGDDYADERSRAVKNANVEVVDGICSRLAKVNPSVRHISCGIDLAGIFPLREHRVTTAYFSGVLEVGKTLKIPVKMAIKSDKEKAPKITKESPLAPPPPLQTTSSSSSPAGGYSATERGTKGSTNLYKINDEEREHIVSREESMNGYRYGKEVVPMEDEVIREVAPYHPPRQLTLLGFINREAHPPRHFYVSHSLVLVADKGSAAAGLALTALVRTLHCKQNAMVLRFKRESGRGSVQIVVAEPVVASETAPAAHFLLNMLPFAEDVRDFAFTSFDPETRRPSVDQADAAVRLITAMPYTTTTHGHGHVQDKRLSEHSANPRFHRLATYCMNRAIDDNATLPSAEADVYLQRVVSPKTAEMPGAEAAAAAVAAALPLVPAGKKTGGGIAVHRLSPGNEEYSFKTMMAQENYSNAINCMRTHIEHLIRTAQGNYYTAVAAVALLRRECVAAAQGQHFNNQLQYFEEKHGGEDPTHRAFLHQLAAQGITLVTLEDEKDAAKAAKADGGAAAFNAALFYQHQRATPTKKLPVAAQAKAWLDRNKAPVVAKAEDEEHHE